MSRNNFTPMTLGLLALAPCWTSTVVAQEADSGVDEGAPDLTRNPEIGPPAPTAPTPAANADEIAFSADALDYDYDRDIVTASGNVVVRRDGYEMRADQVIWNRASGKVTASGSVRTRDPSGNVAYGDTVDVTDNLKEGVVDNMLLVLDGGGRLAARRGQRLPDGTYQLENAAYTGCEVETEDGCPRDPSWQIRASRVTYDPIRERVSYRGARIEIFGLPVVPLPGLVHGINDGPRSGLLLPDIRFDDSNGIELAMPHYFRLAPHADATLTAHVFTDVLPMVSGSYRHMFSNGALQMKGYATSSSRLRVGSTVPAAQSEEDFRGYFESNGQFNFAPNWTLTYAGRIVSDRTFLRRYDISYDDRLRSTLAVERIDENSYFSIDGWAFQTLRTGDPQEQVPFALPRIDFRYRLSDPLLGGQLAFHANSLAIGRADGQDTERAFASARWDLRRLTNLGQQVTFTALARGDIYHSDDNALNPVGFYSGQSGWQGRAIVSGAIDVQWPFVGEAFGGTQTLTPRVQLVATPGLANVDIPNEDSRAVDLTDVNLFALNRFPGYDRYEDNVRMTYGVEWQLNRPNWRITTQVGQSYRLANNSDIVPSGTGLSDRFSDFVGRAEVRFKDFVKFNHRFRLDKDNLAIRRSEFDLTVGGRGTYMVASYLRLNRDIGLGLEDLADKEEIRVGGRVQLDRYWSLFGSTIISLTDQSEDPTSTANGFDPLQHRIGVFYDDGCLELGLTWRYDYESTGDAREGSTFLLKLALRNIGV